MTEPLDIDALAAFAFGTAKRIIESGQEANPCFLIQTPTKGVVPVMTIWRNSAERDAAYRHIHSVLREQNAISYAYVSETWALLDEKAIQKWDRRSSISLHPDRVDCLMCSAYDRNGVNRMILAEVRTTKGKRTVCPPIPMPPEMLAAGRGTDLFLPH